MGHGSWYFPLVPLNLPITRAVLLTNPYVIQAWHKYHKTPRSVQYILNPPCKMNNTTLHRQTKMHKDGTTFSNYQGELYNPPKPHTTFSSTSSPILEYHTLVAPPMTPHPSPITTKQPPTPIKQLSNYESHKTLGIYKSAEGNSSMSCRHLQLFTFIDLTLAPR